MTIEQKHLRFEKSNQVEAASGSVTSYAYSFNPSTTSAKWTSWQTWIKIASKEGRRLSTTSSRSSIIDI